MVAERLREVGHAAEVVVARGVLADRELLGVDAAGERRRHVVLEAVVLQRVGDAGRAVGRGHLLDVDQRGFVVGLVPDLGGDRAREDELDVDAGAREIEVHRFRPAAHRELRRVVRGLVRDRDAAAHARDEHDRPAAAVDHPWEHGEAHARGGVEVDVHDVLDSRGREIGDVRALRDRGVVHERVEAAERVPRLDRDLLGAGEIAEIGGPHLRVGRVLAALGEHFAQPLLAAGDDADGRAACGEDRRQRGTDARRRAGDEDLGARDLHADCSPSTVSRSIACSRLVLGPREDALRHRRRFFAGAEAEHLRTRLVHALVVGRGLRRELGEVAGEAEVARGRELARPVGQAPGAAGEVGELLRERGRSRRLEVGRITVVPAAVVAPDVAHDELGLVVDRPEVRAREQLLGRAHRVHDVVEARAFVHERERLVEQRLQQLGAFGECLPHAVGTDDREAVTGEQHVGVERGHRPERLRPVARVPLHLLRVAAVRRRPDEQVAGEEHLAIRRPHPRAVVGLAAGVVELEALAADVEREVVAVGLCPGTGTRPASGVPAP